MNFDDALRLKALADYRVLDTPEEPAFHNLTQLAARLFVTPIALVSLVDEKRQWFKSVVGFGVRETRREDSFCDHAIRSPEGAPLVVNDASSDPRTLDEGEVATLQAFARQVELETEIRRRLSLLQEARKTQ